MKKILGIFGLALALISGRVLAQGTQISGSQIKDGAITTAKIADGAVTASKFTLGIISNAQIANNAAIAWTKISKSGAVPSDTGAESPLSFTSPLIRTVNTITLGSVPYTSINFSGATPGIIGAENPLTFETPLSRTSNVTADSINFGGVGIDGWFYAEQYNNFTHNDYGNPAAPFTTNFEFDGYVNQAFPGTGYWNYNVWSYMQYGGTGSVATTGGPSSIGAELQLWGTGSGTIATATGVNVIVLAGKDEQAGGDTAVTDLSGIKIRIGNNNNTKQVDNIYGLLLRPIVGGGYNNNYSNAPIAHLYGIYIDDQYAPGTAAGETYQLYSVGKGKSLFKITDASTVPLAVQVYSGQTADAFQVLAPNGTDKLSYIDANGIFNGTATAAVTTDAVREDTPVNPVVATGTFTVTGGGTQIADTNSVTIGLIGVETVYVFKTTLTGGGTTPYEVWINGSDTNALANLRKAINLTGVAGTDYGTGTAIHPTVTSTASDATTLTVNAKTKGVGGNSILTSETGAQTSWGDTHLDNGVDGTTGIAGSIRYDSNNIYICITTCTISSGEWKKASLSSL